MYHYLGDTGNKLPGVLAGDIRVRARITGPELIAAELFASAGEMLVDKMDALQGRSRSIGSGVEEAAAPANKTDDGCAKLNSGSCSEVSAPVVRCFATILASLVD